MDSKLGELLDDALNGFELSEATPPARKAVSNTALELNAAGPSSPSSGPEEPVAVLKKLAFDPLKRRGVPTLDSAATKLAPVAPAADLRAVKVPPEIESVSDDLAKLVSDWAEAFQAEGGASTADGASLTSSALRALQEQTERTIEQQARLNPSLRNQPGESSGQGGEGSNAGMNMIVDTIMQHLLSKEVLYTPMKEIQDKYPPWLFSNRGRHSPEVFARYEEQYECIQRLCRQYEEGPEDYSKLMQLLQEMQSKGEPPQEIVNEMSSQIATDLPSLLGGDSSTDIDSTVLQGLDLLSPAELQKCGMQ